jgi:cytochrome c oxidase subunit II
MENLNELLKMVVPREWLFSVMPIGASIHANDIDTLYWFLIITCGILFLLVIVPLFLIVVRYRRKHVNQRAESQKDHNFWLESLWTFLPFIYLAVLFVWGFMQYLDMYVAPHDAKELRVVGQKWQWSVDYPQEEISVSGVGATIAVPVNTPIKLVMASQDVIHSFYIPNFRVKQDVVPGRYSTLWFKADKLGEFPVLCAEYCGDLHSQMLAKLVVMPEDAYKDWIESNKAQNQDMPLPELGKKLYEKLGCIACHSTDGSIKLAPSFKDVYGKQEELADGTIITVNDNYIKQKILTPTKQQPKKGYAPIMPTFQGRVSERDISGVIEFIKSLSGK